MTDVCRDFETGLAEFNGYGHHVRLLMNFPPKTALSRLVNSLKGVSSGGATGGRRSDPPPAPLHRAARPPGLTSTCPSAFTTGLKAGALADLWVVEPAGTPEVPRTRCADPSTTVVPKIEIFRTNGA